MATQFITLSQFSDVMAAVKNKLSSLASSIGGLLTSNSDATLKDVTTHSLASRSIILGSTSPAHGTVTLSYDLTRKALKVTDSDNKVLYLIPAKAKEDEAVVVVDNGIDQRLTLDTIYDGVKHYAFPNSSLEGRLLAEGVNGGGELKTTGKSMYSIRTVEFNLNEGFSPTHELQMSLLVYNGYYNKVVVRDDYDFASLVEFMTAGPVHPFSGDEPEVCDAWLDVTFDVSDGSSASIGLYPNSGFTWVGGEPDFENNPRRRYIIHFIGCIAEWRCVDLEAPESTETTEQ